MGDKTALIFGSVAYPDWRFLAPLQGQNLTVLCADGGIRCAALAGFAPDFYIGDGDSGGSAQGLPAILLPAEKDLTDLQAACEAAIAGAWLYAPVPHGLHRRAAGPSPGQSTAAGDPCKARRPSCDPGPVE